MKRFFAYARVSTQEQADKDLSIPAQLREIRTFAHERHALIEKEFTDVESAKLPGRTNYTAMMGELAKRADIAGVISHKLDRLLRNLKDYADVDDLMRAGKEFLFVTESYDDSASGKLALGVRVLFAKHYLDNLSEEVRKGMNERVLEKGQWASQPPLGYTMVNGDILPDPVRAPLVKKAFEVYATGDWALEDLTDWLHIQGLRSRGDRRNPKGGRAVRGRVPHFLRNPFYFGMMRYKGQLVRAPTNRTSTGRSSSKCKMFSTGRAELGRRSGGSLTAASSSAVNAVGPSPPNSRKATSTIGAQNPKALIPAGSRTSARKHSRANLPTNFEVSN